MRLSRRDRPRRGRQNRPDGPARTGGGRDALVAVVRRTPRAEATGLPLLANSHACDRRHHERNPGRALVSAAVRRRPVIAMGIVSFGAVGSQRAVVYGRCALAVSRFTSPCVTDVPAKPLSLSSTS